LEPALAAPNPSAKHQRPGLDLGNAWEHDSRRLAAGFFPHHFLEPRVALPPRRFAGKGNLISHKTLDLDDGSLWAQITGSRAGARLR
jgi:hypothetical protein